MNDVETVGGKNASLGEMISHLSALGVSVPGGFATTSDAYRAFLKQDGLDEKINKALNALDVDDVDALAKTGAAIRNWVMRQPLPKDLVDQFTHAYDEMQSQYGNSLSVAVRSSATAEDLPEASFAGQQETILNVEGLDATLNAVRVVFASLFNDRAISYRVHQQFDHANVALSAGIQLMARSDRGSSGVMFTLDTESGFRDVVFITSSYGLGETVVQGAVNPDEFYVYKPGLEAKKDAILRRNLGAKAIKMIYAYKNTDATVQTVGVNEDERRQFSITDEDAKNLAHQALTIENHYGRPMDIEWAKDGVTGELFILQARPETVRSQTEEQVLE
ncbi:MAG: PEP/pyruvate-binding domain-containing protein, partial [Pseudomonadota bacterium]